MNHAIPRRSVLRGILSGAAVTVSLPLLDCFLNSNGTAFASGAPIPVRFGTWFWGCGVTPNRWVPSRLGANYDLKPELAPITNYQEYVSVLSGFDVLLDGKPNFPHTSGAVAIRTGIAPSSGGDGLPGPSYDVLVADSLGTNSRFRSLDLAANGDPRNSLSGRGNGSLNPSVASPAELYARVFGPDFTDPNAADFSPDPGVMARRSVLSAVTEQRTRLEKTVGFTDRARLDEYFTALRQTEQQLALQLQRPAPLEACTVPPAPEATTRIGNQIEDVIANHRLMADILAMALACNQTRVFSMHFNNRTSSLTKRGSTVSHHQLTHEEPLDEQLGYQPDSTWFVERCMEAWGTFLGALAGYREGEGTLLDNILVLAHSDTQYAKLHTVYGIPLMIAGRAAGRIKSGLHIAGRNTPVTRVALTLQQAMGLSINRWGQGSMQTSRPVSEILA